MAASAIAAPIAARLGKSLTGTGGAFANSSDVTKLLVKNTSSALVSATTRVAIQGGKLSWSAVAADALSSATRDYLTGGGASGRQQPNGQLALEDTEYNLGAISRDSGQSVDWKRSIKLAGGGTMTDGLSPTEEAMLAVSGEQVRIGDGNAADEAEIERIVRAKEAAYQGKTRIEARPLQELEPDGAPTIANAIAQGIYSGDSSDYASFVRGYNGEYRSVMEGEAPLAETVGRYAGAAVDSFKSFGDALTGAGSMRNAMASWQRGDIPLAIAQGGMAIVEAGSTVFGFGTAGAIRSAGTVTLRAEAEAVATNSAGVVNAESAALQRIAANNRAGSPAADMRVAYQQAKGQVDFSHIEADVVLKASGGVKAQGGHFSTSPLVEVVPGTETVGANGVLKAQVKLVGPDGNLYLKSNNGGYSTLTPSTWSLARAKGEMSLAFMNRTQLPSGSWLGSSSGVLISHKVQQSHQVRLAR